PVTGVTHYSINIQPFQDRLHPDLGLTTLWGYNPYIPLGGGSQAQKHLGGIIVAQRGTPIQITFTNSLPPTHIIPIDTTVMGGDLGANRASVHLHGGFVPWISDGGPHAWFDPNGNAGPSFLNNLVLNPGAQAGDAEYYYPNDQSARMVWYHDHAWGNTRINAYAGIASAYLIRDGFELNLQNQGLPPFIEASVLGGTTVLELPIVVQDKIFVGPDILTADPTWPGPTTLGSLWYAHVYDTDQYGKLGSAPAGPPPNPSAVPEFFGDTMLANGTVYPEVTVEPRRYRFRILNACNARFLNLQLYLDDGSPNGITLDRKGNPLNQPALNAAASNPKGKPTGNFLVLGTEGGFLPSPAFVPSNLPFNPAALGGSLVLAPAERADVLVDFSPHAGQNLILYSDAPAPFPDGDPSNDYFPGFNTHKNPINALTSPGSGPNTRVILRFKVGKSVSSTDKALTITRATNLTAGNDSFLVPLGVTALPPGVPVRQLTLNETFDEHGRLIQLLGTDVFNAATGSFGKGYMDATTETPSANATEIWQIANLTGDTHPIHFHLVNVQIISRQAFSVSSYKGTPNVKGAPVPPPPQDRGWKETVRMNPGEVTTVIMQFKLPANPPNVPAIPVSPRTGGFEYVWHCHILEHEEHDMMRPLVVT
ncbi:MAG TPA: multicopper oxidase domain-containing protein, partial [Nitrospirota bacterium]|nr:multicopper oxidase domain-containing protein [Nitrospirota bacterium]